MDLETFIATSLLQIANGLRRANVDIGASLEAEGRETIDRKYFMLYPQSDAADRAVEFDVAVTAKSEAKVGGKAKASLWVADAEAGARGSHSQEKMSRVKFLVHVEQSIF